MTEPAAEQIVGTGYPIRPAVASDAGFLADMLVEAVNWSTEWRPKSRARILSAANTAHYVAGWPRATDLGVVAEADGQPAGAAWLRLAGWRWVAARRAVGGPARSAS